MNPADRVIVALDTPDSTRALALADALAGRAAWLKVGMTLLYSVGPSIVGSLRERGFEVFVDLKLHDIPHQVRGAAGELAALGCSMLTVHASGGRDMVASAVEGARAGALRAGQAAPLVVAVTVLTSLDDAALAETGVESGAAVQAARLSDLAREAGADGVVCSPWEASAMRALLGPSAEIVTPGVRLPGEAAGDQARVATPARALAEGASRIVVGRPVTDAADPAIAFDEIVTALRGDRE